MCTLPEKIPGVEAPSWLFLHNCSSSGLHKKGIGLTHPESYCDTLPGAIITSGGDKGAIANISFGEIALILG